MFYSKVRDRYLYIKYVYGIVNIIFWSVYSVWVAIVLILNANPSWRTKNFDFFMLAMLINGIVGSVGAIIAIFFSHFCKKHFFKKYLYELME